MQALNGVSLSRLREMLRKELRQMFRDPRMKPVIFVAPVIQLLVFGYAVSTDVRNTPTILLDWDGTADSRELAAALTASGYFRIVAVAEGPRDLARALDRGSATVGVEIPRGFASDLAQNRAAVQVLVDGTSSNTANLAQGYANRIVQEFGRRKLASANGAESVTQAIAFQARIWYNPELASRAYNVPAVAGIIIMLMCLMLTSLAVVREREIGTLEQLMVSPLKPTELVLGKTLPVALIGIIDLALVTTIAVLWFGIPLQGSLALLLVASLVYMLAGLGLGLLISTVSSTQQEAFMTTFLVFVPAMLLSGFMFPVSSMPESIQWLALLNPIRHFLEIVRGIFLKGAGIGVLWPELLTLLAMSAMLLLAATRRFKKRNV